MSEPKLITPLLADHLMGDPISEHHGVRCCPAIHKETEKKCIVKILSIPATSVQLDALLLSGAFSSKDAALEYFKELADGVVQEAEILQKLSRIEGFYSYDGWQIEPMEDGNGYDVYLLGAYRPTLARFFRNKPITHLAAVNLGLDLCAALSVCRRNGYLYIALKPENVFLTDNMEYRIGDLGFIHLDSLKYASLPERYRSAYTAPEITDAYAALNSTLDIFAAGLILYQAYNNGQLPDMTNFPAEPLAPPQYADYEMTQIILKACAIDPAQRWENPAQMGQELVSYMQRNGVNDVPIVPQPEPAVEEVSTGIDEPAAEEEPVVEEIPVAVEEPVVEEIPATAEEPVIEEIPVAEEEAVVEESTNTEAVADDAAEEEAPLQESEESIAEEAVADVRTEAETEPSVTEETQDAISIPDASDEESVEESAVEPLAEADETTLDEDSIELIISDVGADTSDSSEETLTELEDAAVTDEVSAMLAQADELISHKTPDPVVAPEPIEIPIPAPIVHEPEEAQLSEEISTEDIADIQITAEDPPEPDESPEEPVEKISHTQSNLDSAEPVKANHRRHRGLVGALVATLLVLLLAIGAFFYYENYYLQVVNSITVSGEADVLQVTLDTQVNNTLLTVHCTDINGNKFTSTVVDNKASFTGLHPATNYKITVEISGFHQLVGSISTSYTTDAQISVVSFTAIADEQDGSVTLTFSVQGQENTAWRVHYSAEGESEQVIDCSGHTANITGLTVGKEYTFRLEPVNDLLVVGQQTLQFTAQKVICAQNLQNHGYSNGALHITWDAPEGANVANWIVRCYNNSGFDSTFTVTEPAIAIEGLNPAESYTVDVKAEGMTASQWISISANTITFTDILLDDSTAGKLVITWHYEGVAPTGGWRLFYTVNGSEKYTVQCTTNTCTISPVLPGAVYDISFDLPDDFTVFGGTAQYTAPDGGRFEGYGVTWEDFSFRMCWTPANTGWRWYDLYETDFTSVFAVGDKASFILELDGRYTNAVDDIQTLFVIRDAQGNIVSINNGRTRQWKSMWSTFNGRAGTEFDIPAIPQAAGEYTVDVYFNNALLTSQAFIVK